MFAVLPGWQKLYSKFSLVTFANEFLLYNVIATDQFFAVYWSPNCEHTRFIEDVFKMWF